MGNVDQMIRIIIALVVGVLYWQNIITGTLALVLAAVALVFILTSTVKFCPIYRILGISTCSVDSK
mgnify:CR=1 FL=1